MRVGCGIFVKTPGISPIKTRLARSVGNELALEFYKRSCSAVGELLGRLQLADPRVVPHWAVAELGGLEAPIWGGFSRVLQEGADLGARLHCVYSSLQDRFGNAMLLGADSPLLSVDDILCGVNALQSSSYALGRARDGGFYLLSGCQSIPEDVWIGTPYSVDSTANELLKRLSPVGSIAELSERGDVDTWEDLVAEFAVEPRADLLPMQQSLWDWVNSHLLKVSLSP